ncbi:hypothetical protein, partial [Mesorhizobium sp.]|uniref:hypothetical protein n=1 Tax=Mesorhizobium sp. TaxID=1871066 RepID=UPI00257C8629
ASENALRLKSLMLISWVLSHRPENRNRFSESTLRELKVLERTLSVRWALVALTQISLGSAFAGTRLTASWALDWPSGQVAADPAAPHI